MGGFDVEFSPDHKLNLSLRRGGAACVHFIRRITDLPLSRPLLPASRDNGTFISLRVTLEIRTKADQTSVIDNNIR